MALLLRLVLFGGMLNSMSVLRALLQQRRKASLFEMPVARQRLSHSLTRVPSGTCTGSFMVSFSTMAVVLMAQKVAHSAPRWQAGCPGNMCVSDWWLVPWSRPSRGKPQDHSPFTIHKCFFSTPSRPRAAGQVRHGGSRG